MGIRHEYCKLNIYSLLEQCKLFITDTKEEKFPQVNQNSCIFKINRAYDKSKNLG